MMDLSHSGDKPDSGKRRVGVLLVHGIGMQRPGDTLLTAGDALYSWCQRWFNRPFSREEVTIERASLATSAGDSRASAHALFTFSGTAANSVTSWQLMESYWADAFHPPTFLE